MKTFQDYSPYNALHWDMDILNDMGVSKLSAKVFLKVNYSFKGILHLWKDEYIMGHLCRRKVKLFLNLELSRLG